MRPRRLPGNRQSHAEAGPVTTTPLAERLKGVTFAFGDSSAFIFNVDQEVSLVVGGWRAAPHPSSATSSDLAAHQFTWK